AALILPAIQLGRESARRMTCAAHLRDWTLGVHYYADAHHGYLPRRGNGVHGVQQYRPEDWFNAVNPYIEQPPYVDVVTRGVKATDTWKCPSEPVDDRVPFFYYGMNMWLAPWNAPRPDHREKVGPTSTMVVFSESHDQYCSILPSTEDFSVVARH